METNQSTQNESSQNVNNSGFNFSEIRDRTICELKKWPSLLMGVLTKPSTTTVELPTKGDWVQPIVYGAVSGAIMGFCSAMGLFMVSPGAAIGAFISGIIMGSIGVFVGSGIINIILMIVAKDPGYYRTTYLISILSVFSAIGSLATLVIPVMGMVASLGYLYVLYFYSQSCAGFTKKQSQILVGILVILTVLPFLSSFRALTYPAY